MQVSMHSPTASVLGALALGFSVAACGVQPVAKAPKVHVATIDDLPQPLPSPYDSEATPEAVSARIDAAFLKARAENKRVVIDLGGNWCPWCRSLAGVMALPEVRPFVDANFEVVMVDVSSKNGTTDRNLEVLQRFGVAKVDGYPWLIVAEPDGSVLASSYEVTDKKHETPQGMVNWLAQWAKTPAKAVAVVGGLSRA